VVDVEVTATEIDLPRRRVTLETRAMVGDTLVVKGEALVMAPSRRNG
jgi:3-hydroxybutyryl-CoA dehydratase